MAKSESDSSNRRRGFAACGRLLAAAVAALLCIAGGAQATIINFSATIDAAQETPPSGTPAMASGTFVMDTDANTLSFNIIITVPPASGELFSHIHGFAPPGTPAGILFGLPNGSPKVGTWPFMEAQEANIIAGLTYANIHSTDFPGGEIRGQILRTPSCGDGFLDGGEACDDGNNTNGDCCDSACQFEPASSSCSASLCNNGTCDGAGTCVGAVRNNCRDAGKSILLVKNDNSDDTKDKLIWKWIKGDMTDINDFGAPTGTTAYALCVYTGTSAAAIIDADIAPSATFWTMTATGFKYKDPGGMSDGITKVILKSGAQGKAKALVKGKGGNLPDPPAGPFAEPITAQLVNSSNNVCYQGVYSGGAIIKNEDEQFKAKAQ